MDGDFIPWMDRPQPLATATALACAPSVECSTFITGRLFCYDSSILFLYIYIYIAVYFNREKKISFSFFLAPDFFPIPPRFLCSSIVYCRAQQFGFFTSLFLSSILGGASFGFGARVKNDRRWHTESGLPPRNIFPSEGKKKKTIGLPPAFSGSNCWIAGLHPIVG